MNRPLILDYAIERTGSAGKLFEYDYSKDMNVVKKGSQSTLFINMGRYSTELVTNTRVARERDDEGYNLLELFTKTEVDREQDDEELSCSELETKTFVERERDDENDINYN